jgi:aspartate kinase
MTSGKSSDGKKVSSGRLKVCKFGGTSLATGAQIKKVCQIVTSDPDRRIVVVSAPGKRSKEDIKVTDLLIACAENHHKHGSADKECRLIVDRFRDIAEELKLAGHIVDGILADLKNRLATKAETKEKFLDLLKAAGEDHTARMVAHYLQAQGIDAHYVNPKDAGMLLSDEAGNAQVLPESYGKLKSLKNAPGITIFPGFFGYSPGGSLVTFPRGGSDITGSILAAAVQADVYENFTDVDSVFAANPTIVPDPVPIAELTYREMRELSYAGFSVFHAEALAPVVYAGVPVCIKNTNNPAAPGTRLVPNRNPDEDPVAGIASDAGFCSIYVSKYLMNREIGFGRRLLQILEAEHLSYEHCPSGIDNISVILREAQFTPERESRVVDAIREDLAAEDVSVERNLALIMIVGEGMHHTVGIASRATGALARAGVNIEMINQGSSEVSMMFGTKAVDAPKAVRTLYGEFFKK